MADWKLVPVKPTEEMSAAGDDGHYGMSGENVWKAMLDAAPPISDDVWIDAIRAGCDEARSATRGEPSWHDCHYPKCGCSAQPRIAHAILVSLRIFDRT